MVMAIWSPVSFLSRVVNVAVHCRRHWQFVLSTLLVSYGVVDRSYNAIRTRQTDFPQAARNCTSACSTVCSVPPASFEDETAAVAGVEHWVMPRTTLWFSKGRRLPDGTWGHGLSWHGRDVWWADPRDGSRPVYCQWGWTEHAWTDRYNLWNNTVYDMHASGPDGRLWMDMPGKYYSTNHSADRVQNWLTLQPDSVLPAVHVSPWILKMWLLKEVYALVIMVGMVIAGVLLVTRQSSFGTLGYIITLGALKTSRLAELQHVVAALVTAMVLFYGMLSLAATDTLRSTFQEPLNAMRCCMAMVNLMAGLYSLVTESNPISRRMLRNMESGLRLPMSWHTPSHLVFARLFVPVLMPEAVMQEMKRTDAFHLIEDHVDPHFVRVMTMQELLRIKSYWRLIGQKDRASSKRRLSLGGSSAHQADSPTSSMQAGAAAAGGAATAVGDGDGVIVGYDPALGRTAPVPVRLQNDDGDGNKQRPAGPLPREAPGGTKQQQQPPSVRLLEGPGRLQDTFRSTGTTSESEDPGSDEDSGSMAPVKLYANDIKGLERVMSDPGTLGPTRLLSQSKRGPVSWSKELTKVANVMFSMREYWLLFTSWTANVPGLIKLAMSQTDFRLCRCSCGEGSPSFEDCYNRMMEEQAFRTTIRYVLVACGCLIMAGLLGTRLYQDLTQVGLAEFGTLEYVLRLELYQRSKRRRRVARAACIFSVTTVVLLCTIALARDPTIQGFWNCSFYLLDIVQLLIAGYIINTKTGFITPRLLVNVPDVRLPMAFFQPSELVLSKCLKVAMLTDDEICGTPDNLRSLQGVGVRSRFLTSLSTEDVLAIKRHLRTEETDDISFAQQQEAKRKRRAKATEAARAGRRGSAFSGMVQSLARVPSFKRRTSQAKVAPDPSDPTAALGPDAADAKPMTSGGDASPVAGSRGGGSPPSGPGVTRTSPTAPRTLPPLKGVVSGQQQGGSGDPERPTSFVEVLNPTLFKQNYRPEDSESD